MSTVYESAADVVCEYEVFGLPLTTAVTQCNSTELRWVDGAPATSTLLTSPAALQYDAQHDGLIFVDGLALRRATLASSTRRVSNVSTLHHPSQGWVEPTDLAATSGWAPADGDFSSATLTPFVGFSMAWDSTGALLFLDPLCGLVRRAAFSGEYGLLQSMSTVIGNASSCKVVLTGQLQTDSPLAQDIQQSTTTGEAALARADSGGVIDGTGAEAYAGFAKFIAPLPNATLEAAGNDPGVLVSDYFLLAGASTYSLTEQANQQAGSTRAQSESIKQVSGDPAKSKLRLLSLPRQSSSTSVGSVDTLFPFGTSAVDDSLPITIEQAVEVQSTHVVGMTCLLDGSMFFVNVGGSFSSSGREQGFTGASSGGDAGNDGAPTDAGSGNNPPMRGWPLAEGNDAFNIDACTSLGCTAVMRSSTSCEYKCYHPVCGSTQVAKCDDALQLEFISNVEDITNCFQNSGCTLADLSNTGCDAQCDIPACNFDNGLCAGTPLPANPAPAGHLPPAMLSCLGPAKCPSAMLLLDDECNEECNIADCGNLEVMLGGCAPRSGTHLSANAPCVGTGPSDCKAFQLGDGICDANCFTASCLFDVGDCGVLPEFVRAPEAYDLPTCLGSQSPVCASGYNLLDEINDATTCRTPECGFFDESGSDVGPTSPALDWPACKAAGCTSQSLLSNNKCDMECVHPLCGSSEYYYCFQQPVAMLGSYWQLPADLDACDNTQCKWQDGVLGNGECNLVGGEPGTGCDTPACNYDHGDCRDILGLEERTGNPTAASTQYTLWPNVELCLSKGCSSMHTLFDDKCDPECNVQDCGRGETLFGGCAPNPDLWPASQRDNTCASNGCDTNELGDGTCQASCFIPACGFDLGDCGVQPYQLAAEAAEPGVDLQQCIEFHCTSASKLLDKNDDSPGCRHPTCGGLDAAWEAAADPAWRTTEDVRRQLQDADGKDSGDQFIPAEVLAANTTDTFIDNVLLYALSSTTAGGSGGRGGKLRVPTGSPFLRTRPSHHKDIETTENLLNNVAYPTQLLDSRRQVWFPTTPAESAARIDLFRPVSAGGVWTSLSNATMPELPGRSKFEFISFRGELWAIGGNEEPVLDPSSYAYSSKVPYVRTGNSTASVMIFNLATAKWRSGPSLNVPREDFGVVNVDDQALLVLGGTRLHAVFEQRAQWDSPEGVIGRQEMLASIEVLDAVNATGRLPADAPDGAWLTGVHPDMPFARDQFGAALVGQELWLLGGRKECDLSQAADSPEGVAPGVPQGADVVQLAASGNSDENEAGNGGGNGGGNTNDGGLSDNECFKRTSCTPNLLENQQCDAACNVAFCLFDAGKCSTPLPQGIGSALQCMDSGCTNPSNLYNTQCDPLCDTVPCGSDAGQCSTSGSDTGGAGSAGCNPACNPNFIGNGNCNTACDTFDCGFDGGDCGTAPPAPISDVKACLLGGCPGIGEALRVDECVAACDSSACGAYVNVMCSPDAGIANLVNCPATSCPLQVLTDGVFDYQCYTKACGYAELVYGGQGDLSKFVPDFQSCQANGCNIPSMLQGGSCDNCGVAACGDRCFTGRRALQEGAEETFAGFELPTTSRVQTATAGLVDDASSEWWLPRLWREEPQMTGSEFERLTRFERGWWGEGGFQTQTWSTDEGSTSETALNEGACVSDDLRPYTSVDVYDIAQGRWRQHAARLKVPLVRPAVVSYNKVLYAFGGERLLKFNRQQPVTANDAVASPQYLDTTSQAGSFDQLWNVDGLQLDNLPALARVDFAAGLLEATQDAPLPGFGEALEGLGGSSNRPRFDAAVVAGRLYTPWEFNSLVPGSTDSWIAHTKANHWSWNRNVHMAQLGGSLYTLSDIPHHAIEQRAAWKAGHIAKFTPVTPSVVVDSVDWNTAPTQGGVSVNFTFSVSPAALAAAPTSLVQEDALNVTFADTNDCPIIEGSLQSLGAPVFAVRCTLPAGAGANVPVVLSIPSGSGSTDAFSYDKPVVSALSLNLLQGSGRETLSITGSNFGPPGTGVALAVWWERPDHTVCTRLDVASASITHAGHSTITVRTPAGVGTGWIPRVSVASQVDSSGEDWYARADWRNSNSGHASAHINPRPTYALAYMRPVITSVVVTSDATPGVSPTVGGATLTVSASGMGVGTQRCGFASTNDDAFSGGTHMVDGLSLIHPAYFPRPCTGTSFGTGNAFGFASVTCTVPAGAGSNWTVALRVDGQLDQDSAADVDPLEPVVKSNRIFSYAAPQVFATVPNENGDVAGGQTVTILGSNFGTLNYSSSATFRAPVSRRALAAGSAGSSDLLAAYVGAFLAPSIQWVSDTSIRLVTPQGRGQLNAVVVCILGQCSSSAVDASQALNYFTFVPARVDSIQPSYIFQGDYVGNYTVLGQRFGLASADLSGITVAGASCPAVQRVSDTTVRCIGVSGQDVVPTGESGSVTVSIAGQSSTSSAVAPVIILREPEVVSVTPSTQAVGSRVSVGIGNIVGDPLSPDVDELNTRITIGGLPCTGLRLDGVTGTEASVSCIVPDPGASLGTSLSVQVTSKAGLVSAPNTLFSYFGAGDAPLPPFGLSAVTQGTADPGTRTIQYKFFTVRSLTSDAAVATSMDVYFSRTAAEMTSEDRSTVLAADSVVHSIAALDAPPVEVTKATAWAAAQKVSNLPSELASLLQGSTPVEILQYTLSDSTYQGEPYYFRVGARNPAGLSQLSEAVGPVLDKCSSDKYLATNSAAVGSVVCTACPSGAYCGGQPAHRIVNRAGFWRTPWDALTFAACDSVAACTGYEDGDDPSQFYIVPSAFGLGTSAQLMGEPVDAVMVSLGNSTTFAYQNQTFAFSDSSDSCAEGYTGVLCNRCAAGFAREGKHGCAQCSTPELNVLGLIGGSLMAVFVVGGLTFMALKARGRPGKLPVSILKNLFTHLQVVALASSFPLQWPTTVDVMFTTLDAASSVSDQLISPDCVAGTTDGFSALQGSPFYLRAVVMIALPWMIMAVLAVFWSLHYALSCPTMWEPRTWNSVCCSKCHLAVDTDDATTPLPMESETATGDYAVPVKSKSKRAEHRESGVSASSIKGPAMLDDTATRDEGSEDKNPLAKSGTREGSDEGLLSAETAATGSKAPSLAEMDDDFAASRMSSGSDLNELSVTVRPGTQLRELAVSGGTGGAAAEQAASPGRIVEALLADEKGYDSKAADAAAAAAAADVQRREDLKQRLETQAAGGDATAAKQLNLMHAVAQSEKLMDHWGYFFVSLVVTSFLIHPSLTRTTLALFTCTSIAGSDDLFLVADKSIRCNTGESLVWQFAVGVPFFVLYAFGIPIAAFAMLYKRRETLQNSVHTRATFGFLYASFKPQYYWWEELTMMRKVLFAIMGVLLAPLGIISQVMLAILVLTGFAVAHTRAMPFGKKILNVQEMYSLVVSLLTLQGGLYLFACESCADATKVTVTILIVLINAGYTLMTLYFLYLAVKFGEETAKIEKAVSFTTFFAAMCRGLNRAVSGS